MTLSAKTDAAWKALPLTWSGGTINAEPAGWQSAGFNDSAWETIHVIDGADPVHGYWTPNSEGADFIVPPSTKNTPRLRSAVWITRREFSLAAVLGDGVLETNSDDGREVWVNGHKLVDGAALGGNNPSTVAVPMAYLLVGTNCLAIKVTNGAFGGDPNAWTDNPTMGAASLVTPDLATAVGWDAYAAASPNGAILATIQDDASPVAGATKRAIRIELNGAGSGTFKINRNAALASAAVLARGNLVKCRFPWRSDYDFAFLLESGDFTLAASGEQAGEELTFGGRGGLAYLDRAVMWDQAFTEGLDLNDTWTEKWETKSVPAPSGAVVLDSDPTYVWCISETTRRVYKVRQSDRKVISTSPALFSGHAAGLSGDPADATIVWALEAPWLSGSSAHTKIHKIRRSDWATLATFDLAAAVELTDIRADASVLWCSRYDGTACIQKRSKADGSLTTAYTVSYGGHTQTKANAISVNGSQLALWYEGTKRALIVAASAPTVVVDVISTHTLVSYGGEWTTESGNEFFYPTSYTAGIVWKYQIVAATPHDPVDGIWRLDEGTPGAILARLAAEWQAAGRPQQPLPDMTYGFTFTDDSNGDAWAANDGTVEFDARIGDGGLATVLKLIPYGLVVQMTPDLALVGRNAATYGTDRSSATFAAGKVRFEKGVNIAPELLRRAAEHDQHSDLLAGGGGNLFATAAEHDLGYTREGYVSTQLTDATALEGTAVATLAAERVIADKIALKVVAGDDEAAGLYLPFTHYNVGDVVRVHTGSGETDIDEQDFTIYAITLEENDAGTFPTPILELGSAFLPDATSSAAASSSGASSGSSGGTVIADANVTLEGLDDTGAVASSAIGRTIRSTDWQILQDATGVIRVILTSIGRLLGLSDVDADGIADKQTLRWDATDGVFVPADLEDLATAETDTSKRVAPDGAGGLAWVAGAATIPWFNVKDYGALGNGVADDTAAINLAIAALNAAGSGVLYFPAGTYLTTGGLTTITATALILGDGHGYADSHGGGGSEVRSSSGSNVLFTVTGTGSRFRDIGLRCTAGSTPTAGAGINAQADFIRYDNVAVTGFYDCVDHQNGGAWKMHGCWIVGAVRYGIRVRDTGSPDGGDQSIVSCWIYADQHNGSAAIRVESGGGLKIASCKINMFVSGHKWVHGIDVAPAATTTILIVTGNSIENYTGNGFNYSGASWDQIIVVDNQWGQYGNSSGNAIYIHGANDVHVGGGVFRADTGSPTAIVLQNGTRGLVEPIVNHGFGTILSTSSFTSLDDRTVASSTSFGTPAVTLATSAAAGAASTAIRTDATIIAFDGTAPTTSAVADAAATGSAGVAARRDHKHGREASAAPGTSAVGDAAASGSAGTIALSDHTHGREAFGTPVAVGTANASGSAATVARSDHVHQGASGADDHIHIVGEALTGDGSTTAFLLANEAIPYTVAAYVAGDRTDLTLGGMNDQVTFGAAPGAGAAIRIDYIPLQA